MKSRICELREDLSLRKIPTVSLPPNALCLHLDIVRLAYNLDRQLFRPNCLE